MEKCRKVLRYVIEKDVLTLYNLIEIIGESEEYACNKLCNSICHRLLSANKVILDFENITDDKGKSFMVLLLQSLFCVFSIGFLKEHLKLINLNDGLYHALSVDCLEIKSGIELENIQISTCELADRRYNG